MTDLSQNRCVYCGMDFNGADGNDIVFCPDCGTPVHRECWREHGKCPNEELHASGYQWKSAADAFAEEAEKRAQENLQREINSEPKPEDAFQDLIGVVRIKGDPDPDQEKYMGVSERELKSFLGVNSPQGLYRLAMMKNMAASGKKTSFNIFSGLLKPFYQFYKGMYGIGIPLLLLDFVLAIPDLIYYFAYYTGSAVITTFVEGDAFYALMMASSYIGVALMIVLALFGDYLYLSYAVRRIKTVRSAFKDTPREEYFAELVRVGANRWTRVLQAFLLEAALAVLALFILSRI